MGSSRDRLRRTPCASCARRSRTSPTCGAGAARGARPRAGRACGRRDGADRALLVLGAPGDRQDDGRARGGRRRGRRRGSTPEDVLVLVVGPARGGGPAGPARRRGCARTSGRPLVQTAAAAAFSVLRARASLLGRAGPDAGLGRRAGPAARRPARRARRRRGRAARVAAGGPARRARAAPVPRRAARPADARGRARPRPRRTSPRSADAHRRPVWASAARLYEEYLDVVQLRAGTPDLGARLDPAVVVDEAAQALADLGGRGARRGAPALARWSSSTTTRRAPSATARLLRVLADDGARVRPAGGPGRGRADVPRRDAVAGRAGGRARDRDPGELGARTIVLRTAWRHDAGAAVGRRADHRARRRGRRRPAPAGGPGRAGRRATCAGSRVLPSTAQEAAFVAHALRSAHVERGVPWARDGGRRAVRRAGRRRCGARWPGPSVPGQRARQRRAAARGAGGRGRCSTPCGCASAPRPLDAAHRGPAGVLAARRPRRGRPAPRPSGAARRRSSPTAADATSDALLVEALAVRTSDGAAAGRGTTRRAARPRARRRVDGPRPCAGRRRADRAVGAVGRGRAGRAVAPVRARGRGGGRARRP